MEAGKGPNWGCSAKEKKSIYKKFGVSLCDKGRNSEYLKPNY
jgi:hypothetical protein